MSRPADRILVGDVLDALGGRLFEPGFCESHSGQGRICKHTTDCSLRILWRTLQGAVDRVLVRDGRLTGVLDWAGAGVGDPDEAAWLRLTIGSEANRRKRCLRDSVRA